LEFVKGEGPKLDAVRGVEGLSFDQFDGKMALVYEALRLTKAALADEGFDDTALIGFAGAPWTVLTYMVEGGGSKDFINVKGFAFAESEKFAELLAMVTDATARYLIAQIDAGAEAVKIFDSWAGSVPAIKFDEWVIQPTRKIVEAVRAAHPDVPIIGFARGAGVKYPDYIRGTKITAAAFDQFTPLSYAVSEIQAHVPVQGNLDPALLLAGGDALEKAALEILEALAGKPFVFNLGHGVNLNTPPEHVEQLVRIVREFRS
jgi:uroporphyrinogen decarboxylase